MIQSKNKKYFGENPKRILAQIRFIVLRQQKLFNHIWSKLIKELKKEKVYLVDDKHLNAQQKEFVRSFFDDEVSSSITPLFVEDMAKVPPVEDESIFLGVLMTKNGLSQKFVIIEIPTKIHSRFVSLPSLDGKQNIMLLEDLIRFNLSRMFSILGYTHFKAICLKLTKDAEIDIDNDLSTNFHPKNSKGSEKST